jgi:hypothetical protein
MAEIHLNPVPGTSVVFHQPGQAPLPSAAGKAVTQVKDASGKVTKTAGQVTGTTVLHVNPA